MRLAVIIPVYNEEKAIKKVIFEWMEELEKYNFFFKILIINDGSNDDTKKILNKIKNKKISIFHKKNQGHGKACLFGYKYVLKKNFTHILQLDSDGQCNPKFFVNFYKKIRKHSVVYGYRYIRRDGLLRKFFTRIMEILILARSFSFIKDPNCPYRLIEYKFLKKTIKKIPLNVDLTNVYLTFLLSCIVKIEYIPIIFEKRYYGNSKYGFLRMIKNLNNLLSQSFKII